MRHHRPDYINPDAPYVQIRRAAYTPPLPGWDEPTDEPPVSRWDVSWRSVVYLAGVLVIIGLFLGMFAYGVMTIARVTSPTPAGETWVIPSTYGPPPVGPQAPGQTYRAGIVVRR